MHELTTCFLLWCKRILRRPLFLLGLLLMPLSVAFLQNYQTEDDAYIQVALYAPEECDMTAQTLLQDLLRLSDTSVRFYTCSSAKKLRADVSAGKAACGYLFPEKLEASLQQYTLDKTPFIHAIHSGRDNRTNTVDEIVLSRIYPALSYEILFAFLSHKTGTLPDADTLRNMYRKYSDTTPLFHFEYADGTEHTLLNDESANYLMLPVRGLIAVMVLLSCLTGGLLYLSDRENGLFLANPHKKAVCSFFSLLIPGLFAGVAGLLCIKMAGILTSPAIELPAMLLYILCCMSLVKLLATLLVKQAPFLAAIPILTAASLLLCPVFIDLTLLAPSLAIPAALLPATHYLHAIYAPGSLLSLVLFFLLSLAASASYSRIRGK